MPSLKALGLLTFQKTDLEGLFALNVRRAEAARTYLHLFRDNNIDAILMPPAPHTAVPLDTWMTATFTGLWNYLDYPAVVIPVDTVRESDVADDPSNAKYGPEDARLYSLCMYKFQILPLFFRRKFELTFFFFTFLLRYWSRAIQRCSSLCSSGGIQTCRRGFGEHCDDPGFDYKQRKMRRGLSGYRDNSVELAVVV